MIRSWGNLFDTSSYKSHFFDQSLFLEKNVNTFLPHGEGRSYGDSCLNSKGIHITSENLNHFISFDEINGVIECEAGVTFEQILELIVPRGWFLPVTPGTKFVTVAGAVANDVHGKNHHNSGNFGHFVESVELWRSNGEKLLLSDKCNQELFVATIGGLGLTGFIKKVKFRLIPIKSQMIIQEVIPYKNIDEFFIINEESKDYFYTVSWIDCLAKKNSLGRGLYIRGRHKDIEDGTLSKKIIKSKKTFPINLPNQALNPLTVKTFNAVYYRKTFNKVLKNEVHYDPFFYPLDSINAWNRIYGKKGFYQYQLVIPDKHKKKGIQEILEIITGSGQASFLAVLKTFGSIKSRGLMSFPREGITLALDFPNKDLITKELFKKLDKIVHKYDGSLYIAKDARMNKEMFFQSYPQIGKFQQYIDPNFDSDFWRRVHE